MVGQAHRSDAVNSEEDRRPRAPQSAGKSTPVALWLWAVIWPLSALGTGLFLICVFWALGKDLEWQGAAFAIFGLWVLWSLVIATAASTILFVTVCRPLKMIADATSRMARGDYLGTLRPAKVGELKLLMEAIFIMEERVRQRERQLERSRKEFQTLFENVPSHIAVISKDFRIVEMNRNFRETFGGTEGDLCYRVYKKRTQKCDLCLAEKSFLEGTPQRSEEIGVTRDGEEIPYLVCTAPVVNELGQVDHVIEMSVDLRPIKALEQEKIQAERLSVVGETVAAMAHGIKNILTGLEGGVYVTEVAIAKGDKAMLEKGWGMVERNLERISRLVKDLLAFSRVGGGEIQWVNPNEVAMEAANLFKETALRMNIQVDLDLDPTVGPLPMDPKAIHTCLVNLISNAVDACAEDQHKPDHRIILKTKRGEHGELIFHVEDNGKGMDETIKQRLFRKFFTTKGSRGTGLGLMLTQKLIQDHGGRISVDSEPGKGSCFSIVLPPPGRGLGGSPGLSLLH